MLAFFSDANLSPHDTVSTVQVKGHLKVGATARPCPGGEEGVSREEREE